MYQLASEAGLNPIMPDGGYFMVMDLSSLGDEKIFNFDILFIYFYMLYVNYRVQANPGKTGEMRVH